MNPLSSVIDIVVWWTSVKTRDICNINIFLGRTQLYATMLLYWSRTVLCPIEYSSQLHRLMGRNNQDSDFSTQILFISYLHGFSMLTLIRPVRRSYMEYHTMTGRCLYSELIPMLPMMWFTTTVGSTLNRRWLGRASVGSVSARWKQL